MRRQGSLPSSNFHRRALPAYYDGNYISLTPNGTRTIAIEAALRDFHGEDALMVLDGWNVTLAPASLAVVCVAPNLGAQPDRRPVTGCRFRLWTCDKWTLDAGRS